LTAPSSVIVTATASNERVRYVSIGEVHQMRLQVFSADGRQVFDSDFRLGNLIDWVLTDQQGQTLGGGSYLFLVTVKDFADRLTQKYGTAVLEEGQLYLEQSSRDALSQAQAYALEANKLAEALTPVDRLGAAGFNRGTTTTTGTAPSTTAGTETTAGTGENIAGTGTTNKIAKWTDGPNGVLGDSAISETGGLTVFGQPVPLFPTAPTYHVVEIIAPGAKSPLVLAGGSGVMEFWKDLGGGTGAVQRAVGFGMAVPGTAATDDIIFSTYTPGLGAASWAERMRVTNTGNVGIGAPSPSQRLEVGGNMKISGLGNGVVFADGTKQTTAAAGGGLGGSGTVSSVPLWTNATTLGSSSITQSPGGNIGIGTANPARPLEIANGGLRFSNIYGDIEFTEVADLTASATTASPNPLDPAFRLHTGSNPARLFTVLNNGNVAIGTENFSYSKLYVVSTHLEKPAIEGEGAFVGVRGFSNSPDFGAGILGYNSAGGYAGRFDGKVKIAGKLEVMSGDIAITTTFRGLILKATDGSNCYRVTVNNAGTLITTVVACP
jgi:hypothetical protein